MDKLSKGAKREAARRNPALRPPRPQYPHLPYGEGLRRWYLGQQMIPFMLGEIDAIQREMRSSFTVNGHTYYEPFTLTPRPGWRIETIWVDWPWAGELRKEWGRLVRDVQPPATGPDGDTP